MMANQNRNTIDGFEKTEAINNSPEDLCFDPSDASITPSSDKSIPNNVLDVLVKLGDKKVNNDPKSTADTNNADQSNALLLEDTVSNLLDKIIEKRVNQRLNELGITYSNGSLNTGFIEEIVERHLELRLKDHNFTTQKEPSLKNKTPLAKETAEEKNSKQSLKTPDITGSKLSFLEKKTPPVKEAFEEKSMDQILKAPDITAPKNSSLKKKTSVAKENVKREFKYQPVTKEELLKLCRDESIYLGDIDTSKITDMRGLFKGDYCNRYNRDFSGIESWNVSNVTDMSSMFSHSSFNQNVCSWDVSKVENMRNMFENSSFDKNISEWNVSNVRDMFCMFVNSPFNHDIGSWDVSNVTDMSGMFSHSSFNQNISLWNVSNVTAMGNMFSESPFNQDISSWSISNVRITADMFKNTPIQNKYKPSKKVSKKKFKYHPETKEKLYKLCRNKTVYLGDIDTSKITDMSGLFSGNEEKNYNRDFAGIELWNVSNVTDMSNMFAYSSFNQDIGLWDVSNVTNMSLMFNGSPFNQDISLWNVSNVKNMSSMFYNSSFNQDISSWDVSNKKDLFMMFSDSSNKSYRILLRKNQFLFRKILPALKSIFRDHK